MKAITLWQPWASLVALGLKRYETRSWPTTYRGPIAIHAAKRPIGTYEVQILRTAISLAKKEGIQVDDNQLLENLLYEHKLREILPLGAVVAIARLTSCEEISQVKNPTPGFVGIATVSELEEWVGFWRPGRYAWKLEDVQAIEPVFMNGRQGLWNCELDLELSLEVPV